eukprot:scaffold6.g2882.t1
MNFDDGETERAFRRWQHASRMHIDQIFTVVVVSVHAKLGDVLSHPAVQALVHGSAAVGVVLLVATVVCSQVYVRHRSLLLVATRTFFNVFSVEMVWAEVQNPTQRLAQPTWFGLFFGLAIYGRSLGKLVQAVGLLPPLDWQIALLAMGTTLDLLNNRRLCKFITRIPFQQAAYLRVRHAWPAALQPARGWCAAAGGAEDPGARHAEAACHCEMVFAGSQLLLSLALPVLATYWFERSQRTAFVAKRRRARGPAPAVSHDRMRLLALLAAMLLRLFLALRFETQEPAFAG